MTNEAAKRATGLARGASEFGGRAWIDAFEKYIQQVSDVAEDAIKLIENSEPYNAANILRAFILPNPEPDALVQTMNAMGFGMSRAAADEFRAELAKLGGRIVFDGEQP